MRSPGRTKSHVSLLIAPMCACVLSLLHTTEIVLHVAHAAHVVHVRLARGTYDYSHQVTITFRVIAQAIPTLTPFGLAAVSRQAAAYAAAVLRTRRVGRSGRAMLELCAPVLRVQCSQGVPQQPCSTSYETMTGHVCSLTNRRQAATSTRLPTHNHAAQTKADNPMCRHMNQPYDRHMCSQYGRQPVRSPTSTKSSTAPIKLAD
jgi:hypothetical protein